MAESDTPPGKGDPNNISDADIDALLAEINKASDEVSAVPATDVVAEAQGVVDAAQGDIDALLAQATFDDAPDAPGESPPEPKPPSIDTMPIDLPQLQQAMSDARLGGVDLLRDVELNVKVELGRSRLLVADVLRLGEGSVVELDKLAGDPVDVYVNERLVARGEVLVLNDQFCVRVNEIINAAVEA
jgi:flagellar motor switch protein FliN/FliY